MLNGADYAPFNLYGAGVFMARHLAVMNGLLCIQMTGALMMVPGLKEFPLARYQKGV